MEAVTGNANISTTECGHTFHHQCLYKWHRRHTNCPLCRKEFGELEEEETDWESLPNLVSGMDRLRYYIMSPRIDVQRIVRYHHEQLPLEEYTGEIEERDIRLVAEQTEVSHEMAHRYLRYYHGDIVDAIMYLTQYKDLPIPPFRRRYRPALPEPYAKRTIQERLISSRREEAKSGYESA
jgi:hypothetical protein